MSLIAVTDALTMTVSMVESNDAEQVFGVNAQGLPLGMVARGTPFAAVAPPPPGTGWVWSFAPPKWQRLPTLTERVKDALSRIDNAAGSARLRHITDVPGQQVTYLLKAEQSAKFVALLGVGQVPPFVQAEADATGLAPLAAAQAVVASEAVWTDQQAPAIERERRRGKLAVTAASAAALDAAITAALAALDAL